VDPKAFTILRTTKERKLLQNNDDRHILKGENLVKVYARRRVVNEVSVQVKQGEIVGLLGPNGAGKTTTFYMITGLIKPNSGRIVINDINITNLPMYRRARRGVAYLPQEASIFRKLTVEQNLLAVMQMIGVPKNERKPRCEKFLSELSITHIAKSKGYQLSGGERRRTEIARTLVTDPRFILLDEPFAGVDPIAVEDIQNIVHGLKDRGIGVLITDHNVHETMSITDRAYLLFEGKILKEGSADFLANDEEARKLYLGEKFKLDR
jgi:lipopolysaccharide export system ATP-binding protein